MEPARPHSVTPMDVAADTARRFLVTRQLLAPARSVEGGPDGVLKVFRRLGSVQFDPLSVAERIRAEGPLSALDFERRRGSLVDWFGAPTNVVRAVLEAHAATGVLGLARRDGNRRYYDLIEWLLPPDIVARKVPLREQVRHKLLSRYRAHGLLGIGGGGDIFGGIGPAQPDPERPEHPGRTALREGLIEEGELVPVTVEGVRGKRFVLREEVELLKAPPEPPLSVALLPPFDPLV